MAIVTQSHWNRPTFRPQGAKLEKLERLIRVLSPNAGTWLNALAEKAAMEVSPLVNRIGLTPRRVMLR